MSSKKFLDITGLSTYHSLLKQYIGNIQPKVYYDTTANWNKQTTLVSERGAVYLYSDYRTEGTEVYAGIKIGDGNAYVVDLPFIDEVYADHIDDTTIHVTSTEKSSWNDKVTCYLDGNDNEKLVFTKD